MVLYAKKEQQPIKPLDLKFFPLIPVLATLNPVVSIVRKNFAKMVQIQLFTLFAFKIKKIDNYGPKNNVSKNITLTT